MAVVALAGCASRREGAAGGARPDETEVESFASVQAETQPGIEAERRVDLSGVRGSPEERRRGEVAHAVSEGELGRLRDFMRPERESEALRRKLVDVHVGMDQENVRRIAAPSGVYRIEAEEVWAYNVHPPGPQRVARPIGRVRFVSGKVISIEIVDPSVPGGQVRRYDSDSE